MEVAVSAAKDTAQAIDEALRYYQQLVNRADRLTQAILHTQRSVDALKALSKIAEQYQSNPHCNSEQWIIQLRQTVVGLPEALISMQMTDEMVNKDPIDALDFGYCINADDEQQKKQLKQHQASCQLMEQHCEQSQHYLQLLDYQAQQLREAIRVLLSQVIADPVQVKTIICLQEHLLKQC